jgi:deoxyribodipyrimidine photo-lyase
MRAMLVSFATYNLWLDWKRISHHLARVFLDYEPGIHYAQLQMQAGTTGINAMRVYNVTKQAKDQDPSGVFIRRYVPELRNCPNEYIHEPYNMPASMQKKYKVIIGSGNGKGTTLGFEPLKQSASSTPEHGKESISTYSYYPSPIVDEKVSAKQAKDKLSEVRKQESTKVEAEQVFLKHGSRKFRSEDRDGVKPKVLSSTVKRVKVDKGQTSLLSSWSKMPSSDEMQKDTTGQNNIADRGINDDTQKSTSGEWSCTSCTYLNDKPLALACSICGSMRQ